MNSASNRIAVVTGAGSGIGAAVSRGLARNGFAVVLAGRRFAALEALAVDIAGAGGVALPVSADVGDESSVAALFDRVRERFGRVDLLFNNAGTNARAAPLEELTADEWRSVLRVNLTGAFLCTQQALRMMKTQQPRGGRIINNGSVSAHTPRPHSAPYAAAKHGLTGLTKATALEGRQHDIACGQIDIGNVDTSLGAHIAAGTLQADGSIAREPMMDVHHIVDAVSYMAQLPLDANVLFMTVMATQMPMVGRG